MIRESVIQAVYIKGEDISYVMEVVQMLSYQLLQTTTIQVAMGRGEGEEEEEERGEEEEMG